MAIYDTSTIGTASNRITFNSYDVYPIYRAIRRAVTRRDVREFDTAIPELSGISDFSTFLGKEYFIIEGIMYPQDEASFYTGRQTLRKIASVDIEQADPLSDQGYVPYIYEEVPGSGRYRQLNVKVLYVDMQESTAQGIVQPFKLYCKVKRPVIIDPTAVTTTLGVTNIGTINGATTYPFTYPVVYGKTTYSSGGSINNQGDLDAYPAINVYGPVNVPRITNTTTGKYIEVNTNLASTSDVLSISYEPGRAPTITVNGVSVYNLKTSGSTLFPIRPGGNDLTLSAASLGTGSYATVSCYSTWPIS